MRPITETLMASYDSDGVGTAHLWGDCSAEACAWLLQFCGQEKPWVSATAAISDQFVRPPNPGHSKPIFLRKLLQHLLMLVLVDPRESLPDIFSGYSPFILGCGFDFKIAMLYRDINVGIDVARILKVLGADHLEQACELFATGLDKVVMEAIACDDVELFTMAWERLQSHDNTWEPIARFELLQGSAIQAGYPHLFDTAAMPHLLKAGLHILRKSIEVPSSAPDPGFFKRNPPGTTSTLAVGTGRLVGARQKWLPDAARAHHFFENDGLISWMTSNPSQAISVFYHAPTEGKSCQPERIETLESALEAFLAAGVSIEDIINQGALKLETGRADLEQALSALSKMNELDRALFAGPYRRYLQPMAVDAIIDACKGNDPALVACYELLNDRSFLQALSEQRRLSYFSADLGL